MRPKRGTLNFAIVLLLTACELLYASKISPKTCHDLALAALTSADAETVTVNMGSGNVVRFARTDRPIAVVFWEHNLTETKLKKMNGMKVLDAGTGGGSFVKELVKNGVIAHGVDIVLTTEQESMPHLFSRQDMLNLKFADGFFDKVFSTWSLLTYESGLLYKNPSRDPSLFLNTIRELMRVLKPGGELLISPIDTFPNYLEILAQIKGLEIESINTITTHEVAIRLRKSIEMDHLALLPNYNKLENTSGIFQVKAIGSGFYANTDISPTDLRIWQESERQSKKFDVGHVQVADANGNLLFESSALSGVNNQNSTLLRKHEFDETWSWIEQNGGRSPLVLRLTYARSKQNPFTLPEYLTRNDISLAHEIAEMLAERGYKNIWVETSVITNSISLLDSVSLRNLRPRLRKSTYVIPPQ